MKIIDRYLVKLIMPPFLGGIIFFIFILLLFQMIRLTPYFILHGVSIKMAAELMGLMGLGFIPISIPISFLFSVIFTFGRLSSDSEFIALRAAGWSLNRLMTPPLIMGFVLSLICLYATLDLVPLANHSAKERFHVITGSKVGANLKSGTFTPGFFNLAIFVKKSNPDQGLIEGVFIFDERDKKNPLSIIAERGLIIPRKGKDDLPVAILLRLYNGSIHRTPMLATSKDSEKLKYQKIIFDTYDLLIKIPEINPFSTEKPATMRLRVLNEHIVIARDEHIAGLGKGGEEETNRMKKYMGLRVEFWKRIAIAWSCIIFALLGVVLGIQNMRSVKSNSFLYCILVLVFYYSLYIGGAQLAAKGRLPVIPVIMFPNVLFLGIGVWLFRRAARN